MAAIGDTEDLEQVRLLERLAILDEVHDALAHELAVASIHLGLLASGEPGRPAAAPGVAHAACRWALDAVRHARAKAAAPVSSAVDEIAADLGHLHALAAGCGARVTVEAPLPAPQLAAAGVLLTAARTAEAFLRLTAGHDAHVVVSAPPGALAVAVTSALPADAWTGAAPDLERVRERLRYFDGRFGTCAHLGGSTATATLPLG